MRVGGLVMDYHPFTLTLDAPEGYVEAEATLEIDAAWSSRRDRYGMRSILHVNEFSLSEWTFDGRKQTRETAVALIGAASVEMQEQLALDAWRSTAEQDDAEEYADYARDLRMDMAAE